MLSVWLTNGFVGMPRSYGRASLVSEQDGETLVENAVSKGVLGGEGGARRTVSKRRGKKEKGTQTSDPESIGHSDVCGVFRVLFVSTVKVAGEH